MKAYELIDSPEKWVNHSSLGFELEQIMSIRELFASDRGLFANGRAFAMMEASCHRQVQRSVHGNYAEVPARKYDPLARARNKTE